MVKIYRRKTRNYTVIDNQVACDKNLSWHARGIFLYLYSQGDEWEFLAEEVIAENIARHDTFMQGISELEQAGYLRCAKIHPNSDGKQEKLWELSMLPVFGNVAPKAVLKTDVSGFSPHPDFPAPVKPVLDYPPLEKPVLENPQLISTNKINTKYNKQQSKQTTINSEQNTDRNQDACTQIITHLNAKTGRRYNPKAISTRKLFNARLQEGYQVEDFIKVIDTKVSHWLNDEKYNMYLRPGTLFGAKFDNYINENVSNSDKRNGSCSDEEVWYE